MSLDELARSASADLRLAVDRQVAPEAARERLDRRMAARRYERGLTAVAIVAFAAVGFVAVRDVDRPEAMPAGPAVIDPTAAPASDCLLTMNCPDGAYRARLAIPTTFRSGDTAYVESDTPDRLAFADPQGMFGLTLLAEPVPVGAVAPRGRTAKDLADWLTDRSDVVVSSPMSTTLGGRPALSVDVHAKASATHDEGCPGWSACVPLLRTHSAPSAGGATMVLDSSQVLRIYLLDVPGDGTLAVVVEDSTIAYAPAPALASLRTIMDSLAFGTP